MDNLYKAIEGLAWTPDADSINAPAQCVLRADNTVPDVQGARVLRKGSTLKYALPNVSRVHSLYQVHLQGVDYLMAGADNRVFVNGALVGDAFDGTGDIIFGDDAYQSFAARGTVKKKWDGTTLNNWSIDAPALAPVLSAAAAVTASVASFDSAESPAFVINEGTAAFVPDKALTAGAAMQLKPDAGTGRASASKKFVSDQDFFNIATVTGSDTDLFDITVWFQDWRKVDRVTVMFGLGTGADPYADDYYYFDFNIRQQDVVNIKDPKAAAAAAYKVAAQQTLASLSPQDVTNVRSPQEAADVLARLGRYVGPQSRQRIDAQEASPAWGHLSVSRGAFSRQGGTPGRSWSTVRAFKVVFVEIPGSSEVAYFDTAMWTGGGDLSLTGTFTVGYRFARKFTTNNGTKVYYELSPMSPISTPITLNQQSLTVTIPAAALAGKDPQVGEVWTYIQGGWLDTYYRFAVLTATPRTGMQIDDIWSPIGGDFNSPEKRSHLLSWGFSQAPGAGAASADLVFSSGLSELQILIDNEKYVPGTVKAPDNIVAIAGPWQGRMFVLDSQGFLWPSSGESPSSFSFYHAIDLRRYGTPLWLVNTSSGIAAGFSDDIIRIAGTGDETVDRAQVDLYGDPLNVGNPPIDKCVMTDRNAVVYRSADGMMILTGSTLNPVPAAGTSLLWRGQSRHGVSAVNLTGRFRVDVSHHILYTLVSEGTISDPATIWQYNPDFKQWSRLIYPFTPISVIREMTTGNIYVGTTDGRVMQIETGVQDSGADIAVEIHTPFSDGGDKLRRKDVADIQIHCSTGGKAGLVSFLLDIDADPVWTIPLISAGTGEYRSSIDGIPPFLHAQMRFTGSFSEFILREYNLTYRARPQQTMLLDCGFIIPENGGDMAWLTEGRLDVYSMSDLLVYVIRDGVQYGDPLPVVVNPGVRGLYRVVFPKATKARRLQLKVATTAAPGYQDPGFEPYSFRVRHRGSGNMTELLQATGDNA